MENKCNVGDLILVNGYSYGILLGYEEDYIDFSGYKIKVFSFLDLKDGKKYWCPMTESNIEKLS